MKDIMKQDGRVEEAIFGTTCVDQMSSDMVPESFVSIKVSDMSQESVKIREFPGLFPKIDDLQKGPGIRSPALLCYYSMRWEEGEEDAIWKREISLEEETRAINNSLELKAISK